MATWSARRFLLIIVGSAFAIGSLVPLLNFALDSAGYLQARFNLAPLLCAPGMRTHHPYGKIAVARARRAEMMLMGNSRVGMGLDPEDASLKSLGLRAYNLYSPGMSLEEVFDVYERANLGKTARVVVIAVDAGQFWGDGGSTRTLPSGYVESWLAKSDAGQTALDLHFSFLSRHASLASLRALIRRSDCLQPLATPLGMRNRLPPRPERYGPHWAAFLAQSRNHIINSHLRTVEASHTQTMTARVTRHTTALQHFIQRLQHEGVAVKLFINPLHAQHQQIIHQVGLWPQFEQWKRGLSVLAESTQIQVLDFATHNEITERDYPKNPLVVSDFEYFYEFSHYTPKLGGIVLRRLFEQGAYKQELRWSAVLEPATIEAHLARERAHLARYARAHVGPVQEIEHAIAQTRARSGQITRHR